DKNWDEFTKALSDATKRNVYVKIMFSNCMFTKSSYKDSNDWLQKLIHQSNQNHLKIKYTSLPHTKQCVPFSEVDHAKYAIFDGTIAWVSTSNIQKSYLYAAKNYC
ncbi:phospholipase D-like domain-containing protein, partial [Providencia rettgeri]|uniref:phospholipase D-like domain-containing protein n=1 Tax=Providencia rettgeri TaxID=587 RepID=UPI001EF54D0A